MARSTITSFGASLLTVVVLGSTAGTAAHAETPSTPKFELKELSSAATHKDCTSLARNLNGNSVVNCGDKGLKWLSSAGEERPLYALSGATRFLLRGRVLLNERNTVAGAGDCLPVGSPEARPTGCFARWDANGTLTLLPISNGLPTMHVATSINRHGDLLTSAITFSDSGEPTFETSVWWVNGKTTVIKPTTTASMVFASGITDGRDVYGAEGPLTSDLRTLTPSQAETCLQILAGNNEALIRHGVDHVKPCLNAAKTPMRWREGRYAQTLKGLSASSGASVNAVSPSGNHLVGYATEGLRQVPIHWGGVNDVPTLIPGLPQAGAFRSATFVNNHNVSLTRELAFTDAGLGYRSWLAAEGKAHDLSKVTNGLPEDAILMGENVDRHGNVYASLFTGEDLTMTRVLLTRVG